MKLYYAIFGSRGKTRYIYARIKAAATPVRGRVACVVVWTRDMEIVVATTEGRMAQITLGHMAFSDAPWKPVANVGTWRFRKRGMLPRCVGGNPGLYLRSHSVSHLSSLLPLPPFPSCFPTARRRLIRGINSARVTKNRGGETAPRFTMSRFPSRGIPCRYLFSVVLREISPRFSDLETSCLKPA